MPDKLLDIPNPYIYVRYDEEIAAEQETLKAAFEEVTTKVLQIIPAGRCRSLCLTALEEAYMWTGKGQRDKQIAKTNAAHEPARG
jgi:hypothetical protein